MKIDNGPLKGVTPPQEPQVPQVSKAPRQGEAAKKGKTDEVALSQQALEFQRAEAAVRAASDSRAEKVAQIRQQILNGTYHVSEEAIARKILESGF